ncbi:hypothetical protein OJF2_51380 [Aquisphaera giovannonii]|uniref:Uncharacterized protein n=1 Tax=Aquisphaera giovannonii TaxID=406548 RepID=A0A5B9W8I4_9BACT|nr:hypothetical protein [Aquisphaera giovannonii]QEH36554.1 hypothetical protein OJF2_51380 [Aquisphaera giovannonii]
MHYHLEVILPPVPNVEEALKQILEPFNEQGEDEDGNRNSHAFWDWYVIGGRWAGAKLEATLDQEKLEAFNDELQKRKVTVSGVRAGKPKLQPDSQIPMVDALWNEYFPDSPLKVCPFFAHFNDQYQNSDGFPDIMPLKDVPKELTASHVIIAGPGWKDDGSLEAKYMLQASIWNGVTFVDAKWDGKVQTAIDEHKERLRNAKPEYAAKHVPQDDWLVVTVDYHS